MENFQQAIERADSNRLLKDI